MSIVLRNLKVTEDSNPGSVMYDEQIKLSRITPSLSQCTAHGVSEPQDFLLHLPQIKFRKAPYFVTMDSICHAKNQQTAVFCASM